MKTIPLLLLALAGSNAPAPERNSGRPATRTPASPVPTKITSIRISGVPVLDGRDDDDAWRTARSIDGFRQYAPREDAEPLMQTTARIAHDAQNLYVLIRSYDPAPDSIVSRLSRRDVETTSDRVFVGIDSYRDRKSGFEFAVTPNGVRMDAAIINDSQEDRAWDAVWDVATRIDSLGWVAEFRIPFSQLRFTPSDSLSFGLMLARDVARTGERQSWPVLRRSRPGIASQFGELDGLHGVLTPRRIEITPYSVTRSHGEPRSNGQFAQATSMAAGADLKLGLSRGLRVDATINPDFGQVDADPSVINLSVFEQIYEERRPFFVEGSGLFRYDITCGGPACNGLFYSRRIGRAPQLASLYGDPSPAPVRIVGAAKLTGRSTAGLSVGILTAATAREAMSDGRTTEPASRYGVARVQRDWRGGLSTAGLMLTHADRSNDEWTRSHLRDRGTVLGFETRNRIIGGQYMVRAYGAVSHVEGTAAAMLRTRRGSAHYYQRPDDGATLDTTDTTLDGTVVAVSVSKQGGGATRWSTAYRYTSQGFEPNDVGFLTRSDYTAWQNSFALVFNRPTRLTRQANVMTTLHGSWNTGGQFLGGQTSVTAFAQLPNFWSVNTQWVVDGFGAGAVDDRLTRGGPSVRRNPLTLASVFVTGDDRRAVAPRIGMRGQFAAEDGSWQWGVDPGIVTRRGGRLQSQLGASYLRAVNAQQWMGAFTDSARKRYTYATLDQRVFSLTGRLDLTLTPNLSFQLYASPFIAVGQYRNWNELVDPRAERLRDRVRPFTERGSPSSADFNVKQFRSNAVMRWEYRPGSTLYVVWFQGRDQADRDLGDFSVGRDLGNLLRARANNMVQVKASYWLTPGWPWRR